ncbi:MAG: hypothetical protein LBD17_03925, partial [Endomicrobium sp.]|nr:hypothetical protein [Endomicrobium sp.]
KRSNETYLTLSNNNIGIKKLLKTITLASDTLVIVDLTSRYEIPVTKLLLDADFNVRAAQGRNVRSFFLLLVKKL